MRAIVSAMMVAGTVVRVRVVSDIVANVVVGVTAKSSEYERERAEGNADEKDRENVMVVVVEATTSVNQWNIFACLQF